jgi:peptide/nickel transport system permease protein
MQLAPGGPDTLLAKNGRMSQAQLAAIRKNLGLDEPMHVQLWTWIKNLFQGDLGTSFTQQRPVRDVILDVFPNTLYLMSVALVLSLLIAVVFGIGAAVNQYGWFDNATSFLAYFGLSMPVFWFGLMLQILFAVKLGWLPSAGMHDARETGFTDMIQHMILPAVTLAIGSVGSWSRYLRASTLEVMGQDYVRTARAKGLGERQILVRHVLRNSMIPIITLWGLDFGAVLGGGAILTETVFDLQGVGQYTAEAIGQLDVPPVLAVTMFSAFFIVLLNAIVDIMYAYLDPRIRLQ